MLLRIFFVLCFAVFAYADNSPILKRTGKEFDPSIPTIQSVLGYDFGERITRHAEMERYLQALAKSSRKVLLQKIGESYEGRALYYLIISSEQNIARLEELRLNNLKLADPRVTTESQAKEIIEKNPLFVTLSYSVHGAEHSGTEAAMALSYYLISSNDLETAGWLDHCVFMIDPLQNPDGRERFIEYFYSVVGPQPNPDRNAAEHNQEWPGGRYNHYLFDMNRDWTVLSQQETRARVTAYRRYQPEIFVDVHEMTEDSSYFFPPPSIPRNPNIPPSMMEWWDLLGHEVAAEFDRNHVPYFTSERFDFWYPGYGDTWPTYNGALAGTFEQASVRGLVRKRSDGIVVDYKDAIWHHFLSSRSVCRLASQKRKEKLIDFYHFRSTAIQEGKTGPIREFVLRRASDPLQTDRVVGKLIAQGIEVHQAEADFRLTVQGYYSERSESKQFSRGDYIIFMNQPLERLIRAMFEKETQFDARFLEAEEERRKEKEPSELYDITAWSLPYAMGIEAYWSGEQTRVQVTAVQNGAPSERAALSEAYAYVIDYDGNQSLAAINKLLEHDIRIYFSSKPFSINNKEYRAGSCIIRSGEGNPSNLAAVLTDVAKVTAVEIDSVPSGWTTEGPDFGSDDVYFFRKPKIGVLTHLPTDPTSYGSVAYLLQQRYEIPFTALQTYDLVNLDIRDYNVLVMPDEDPDWGHYKNLLGDDGIKKIRAWVENGGTLIALAGGAKFLVDDGKLTRVRRIKKFVTGSAEEAEQEEDKDSDTEDVEEAESPDSIPGSIGRVVLNLKHFLTFGYPSNELPVFINSSNVFVAPANVKPVASYADADSIKIAGLFWDIARQRLARKAYLTHEALGKGQIILFAEDPNFRSYWESLTRLFLNGILFGPSMLE